jgi:hypothetical protein
MDTLPELKAFNYRQEDAIHSCYILSGDQNLLEVPSMFQKERQECRQRFRDMALETPAMANLAFQCEC